MKKSKTFDDLGLLAAIEKGPPKILIDVDKERERLKNVIKTAMEHVAHPKVIALHPNKFQSFKHWECALQQEYKKHYEALEDLLIKKKSNINNLYKRIDLAMMDNKTNACEEPITDPNNLDQRIEEERIRIAPIQVEATNTMRAISHLENIPSFTEKDEVWDKWIIENETYRNKTPIHPDITNKTYEPYLVQMRKAEQQRGISSLEKNEMYNWRMSQKKNYEQSILHQSTGLQNPVSDLPPPPPPEMLPPPHPESTYAQNNGASNNGYTAKLTAPSNTFSKNF